MKKSLLLSFIMLFLGVNCFAATLTLKSGEKFEGEINEMGQSSITFILPDGTATTYSLTEIDEIDGQKIGLAENKNALTPNSAMMELSGPDKSAGAEPQMEIAPNLPEKIAAEKEPIRKTPAAKRSEQNQMMSKELPQKFTSDGQQNYRKPGLTPEEEKIVLAFLKMIIIIFLVVYIYSAICLQAIAIKTLTPPAWLAWVPIANFFLMCKVGKVNYLWLLLLLVSFIPLIGGYLGIISNLFLLGLLWYKIALARGKNGWLGIVTVVPIVGLFTTGYLAFSK